jgi:hypothetical protein
MSETELAWAAGFYDGEGSVSVVYPSKTLVRPEGYATLHMKVSQKDIRPLHRFCAAVGVGRVTGPYGNDMHSWQIGGNPGVRQALTRLWPYLSPPKREQAEAAQAVIDSRPELARDARKRTIFSLQAQGLTVPEIAQAVGRSPRTIYYHLRKDAGGR